MIRRQSVGEGTILSRKPPEGGMVKKPILQCNASSRIFRINAGNRVACVRFNPINRKVLPDRKLQATQKGHQRTNLILRIGGCPRMFVRKKDIFEVDSPAVMEHECPVRKATQTGWIKLFCS